MTATVRAATSRPPERNGIWGLAAAQYAYTVWFAVCAIAALSRAAHFAGHFYIPAANDAVTANADVVDGWPWAGPVMATGQLGPLASIVAVAVSIGLLSSARVRAYRGQWVTLLISTLLVVGTLVAALSPAGVSVTGWVLD